MHTQTVSHAHVFVFVYRGALIDASFNVDFYLNRT